MGERRKRPKAGLLTAVELELMQILWTLGEGTVHEVIDNLSGHRNLAYTSVSTMLRILEQKQMLGTRKFGRSHIYRPLISQSEYEARSVQHLVSEVFSGQPLALAKQLLDVEGMSSDDIQQLRSLLDDRI